MNKVNDYKSLVGTTLGGRYLILKEIGDGGMATVFAAYDRANGETVAIKLLNENLSDSSRSISDLKKQFADEARIHSLVSHPAVAAFKRAYLDSSPTYFVMEYVDGVNLKEYMYRNRGLTWEETINFSCRLLSALSHIHSKNIVHCDIKPQNILITHSGSIKIIDFGIARMAGKLPDLPKDKAVGTVQYVSPEQAEGKPLDHRSDLYSMGILLYEMATDRLPFNHRDPDRVAQMHSSAPPPRPRQIDPSVPKGLEQVILKAIAKKPYMRFDSADEIQRHLEMLKRNPNAVFRLQTKQPSHNAKYQPSASRSIIAGVLAAFIAVASLSIPLMNARIFRGADGRAVKLSVPDLWGYSCDAAINRLDERYYDVDVIYSYNSGRRPGLIIDQSPTAGTRIKVDSGDKYTITVTVSSESRTLTMIDVTAMTPTDAQNALLRQGYSVVFESKHSDTVTEGRVCGTLPAFGESAEGGSSVTVYVSLGADTKLTLVPSMTYLHESVAAERLEENGLRVGNITYKESDQPIGTVLSHSFRGQSVPVGTAIDFEISGGK